MRRGLKEETEESVRDETQEEKVEKAILREYFDMSVENWAQ